MERELLQVLDLSYNKLAILNDNSEFSVQNDVVEDLKINGIDKLTFSIPIESDKWEYLLNENLIYYKNELYTIKIPRYDHTIDNAKTVQVECLHLSSGLQSILIEPIDAQSEDRNGIGKSASHLMSLVLQNTGWTLGDNDIPSDMLRSLQTDEQSVFSAILQIAELFDASVIFTANPNQRKVHLRRVIDRGFIVRKNKNLKNVSIQYDSSELVTKLYVFGGQDLITGNAVTIHEAKERDENGNIIYENGNPVLHGKSYIEDYSYFTAQGYTMQFISQHPELFKREQTWNANEYVLADDLYVDGLKRMKTLSKPKVKVTLESLDLSQYPEHKVLSPILGETVKIIDEDFNLVVEAKIIGIRRSLGNPNLKLEISNEIEYHSIIKRLMSSTEKINRILTPQGAINAQTSIEGTLSLPTVRLNSERANWYTDNNGNMIFENLSKTEAIKLGSGGIYLAKNKDMYGNYNFVSFGTGAGFNANQIIKGVLKSGAVEWNLDNGTFIIKNPSDLSDYLLKYDGNALYIKNATTTTSVTWNDILNKPTIPSKTSEITNDSGFITSSSSISGNANTATKLQTPRTINGVNFDGSSNITITANPNAHNHDDRYYTESEADGRFVKGNGIAEIKKGLESAMPTATGSGTIYFATDTKKIYQDTASGVWTNMGGQDTFSWNEIINKPSTFTPPVATNSTLGGIKVGANLTIGTDGTLSGNSNPAYFIRKQERFITVEGQTTFNLSKGVYTPNTNSIWWYLNGIRQDDIALIEVNSTTVKLPTGISASQEVMFEYFQTLNLYPFAFHSSEHGEGGSDAIPIATASKSGLLSKTDKSKIDNLKTVALTGSYNDLIDKPNYALSTHLHDDRYYTETESDNRFVKGNGVPEIQKGSESARPTATGSYKVYFATDTKKIWQDTGSGVWTQMGGQDVPLANSMTAGIIKVGAGLSISSDGVLNAIGGGGAGSVPIAYGEKEFIATANQTNYILDNGESYIRNSKCIEVYLDGIRMPSKIITEVSDYEFALPTGISAGTVVFVKYVKASNMYLGNHAVEHLTGGEDPIPLATTTQNGLMNSSDKNKLDNLGISNISGLQTALDGKSGTTHTHDDRYYTETEVDTKLNTKLNTSDVVTTATASKILKLDANGQLPASITGNANTATKLANSKTINGVAFDGSANITITADPNAHTHTKSNITDFAHTHTKSEVTDFPTLATVATSGSYTDLSNKPTIPTNTNQLTNGNGFITSTSSITGNASTATKLQTARTINGVSFDGTANISITADPNSHTHDDRYYTETEADSKFVKANGVSEIQKGLESAKPTATGSNKLYFATDTKKIWQDTATNTWTQMGGQDVPIASTTQLGTIKVGANLSVSADGTLNANSNPASFIRKQERFTVGAGQTVFNLVKGNYNPNTSAITWYLDGIKQDDKALVESSSTSVTLPNGLPTGSEVMFEYFQIMNLYPTHEHNDIYYTETEVNTLMSGKANSSHTHTKSQITDFPVLSTVATSGSYNDLSNKPTIIAINDTTASSTSVYSSTKTDTLLGGKANSSHSHTKSQISDFPTLATVATSGSYNDLSNKPTIVAINDTTASATSVYSSTKTDALLGGKANSSHTHTKSQITDFPALATVATSGSYDDLSNKPTIPTNTNQLTNGSGFITSTASITGNSATATKLQTARTINGVSFDGSANISITANPNAHTHDDRYYTESEADTKFATKTELGNAGYGDMMKSVYDTNSDGIIDRASTSDVSQRLQTYVTPNTSNLYQGQYTKLARVRITSQYQDGQAVLQLIDYSHGTETLSKGTVFFRVKQQNPLGGVPLIDLKLTQNETINISHLIAVTTVNNTTETIVELYLKTFYGYSSTVYTVLASIGSIEIYNNQPHIASLPNGTQTACKYLPIEATKLQTARKINGVSFDGTSDITITANPNSHTHDDVYYTETEVNNLLTGKFSINGGRITKDVDMADDCHIELYKPQLSAVYPIRLRFHQGGRWWHRLEVDNAGFYFRTGDNASNAYTSMYAGNVYSNGTQVSVNGHTHDDRYYTETEVNNLLANRKPIFQGASQPTGYVAGDYWYKEV